MTSFFGQLKLNHKTSNLDIKVEDLCVSSAKAGEVRLFRQEGMYEEPLLNVIGVWRHLQRGMVHTFFIIPKVQAKSLIILNHGSRHMNYELSKSVTNKAIAAIHISDV